MSSSKQIVRHPSHAGSWYTSSGTQLNSQLDGWLDAVDQPLQCIGPQSEGTSVAQLPVPGARMIIAPHAGYSYSGPAAAWAYKCWDISRAKRVILLGPSHHHYLTKAALSKCTHYATPLGNLKVDQETTATLYNSGQYDWMAKSVDEEEHSLEMHLPYIYKMLSRSFGDDPSNHPPLVPIMVGNTSARTERTIAHTLAPYFTDPTTAFVISSDFAHWGTRFRYTYYQPSTGPALDLKKTSESPTSPAIHESIKAVDFECMGACEGGKHGEWLEVLERTGNTVCGRHPIGVVMAGLEEVQSESGGVAGQGSWKFTRYARSGEVSRANDSSVSYASAFFA